MAERNPVQELTDALTLLRVDLSKVAEKIDAKAATPAQLEELSQTIKAANPAELGAGIQKAAQDAALNIENRIGRRIHDVSTGLDSSALRLKGLGKDMTETTSALVETTNALVEAIGEARTISKGLYWHVWLVMLFGLALVAGGSWASLWWQRHQADTLADQATALAAQVAQEKATLADLDAKGGRVQWSSCGGRLCFYEAQDQGGGWDDKNTGDTLVIPKGY